MNRAEISERTAREAAKINAFLASLCELETTENDPRDRAAEAEKYALSAGGKRIRAVLAVEFYKLFSGEDAPPDCVYEAACAVEMVHTFSLIHDDMPEMDNDDMRRGKPSTHIAYGTAIGLLAGDGLAILPFEILSRLALDGKISYETAVKLMNILSRSAGNRGMIAGQVLDLWSEDNPGKVDEAFLRDMSELKTGRMLEAACFFGAVLAGADEEGLRGADLYAKNVGLAFQIVDDILDVTASREELGKPVGSDMERGKPTFADIMGTEAAAAEAKRLGEEAARAVEKYPGGEYLSGLAVSLSERKN